MKLTQDGKPLNIFINKELYDKLKEESEKNYVSMAAMVRMILKERYINGKMEKQR